MKHHFITVFTLLTLTSNVIAQHGSDITNPSDIWPNTRAYDAMKMGANNPLFMGGNDASSPISWGAYPDDKVTAPRQHRFYYNGNSVMNMSYHPWSNAFIFAFNDESQSAIQGDVVQWKDRLTLTNLGALKLLSNDGLPHFSVNENGELWARKVTVTANAIPDYVFAKEYKLMPLTQLKSFIEKEKHLPNIKSAGEYNNQQNKIDIGEMQLQLLEKVEELTLYILQQQAEIDALKAKLAK